MDELAAEAAVVMRTVDANAGVEVGQHGSCVASIAVAAALPGCESSAEDKESNSGDAAPQYPEDAVLDLSNAPLLRRKSPSAQHFSFADSTWCAVWTAPMARFTPNGPGWSPIVDQDWSSTHRRRAQLRARLRTVDYRP